MSHPIQDMLLPLLSLWSFLFFSASKKPCSLYELHGFVVSVFLFLPFLAEIRYAKAFRRLIFPLASDAGDDQHHQGNHVGNHLIKLLVLHVIHTGGDVQIDDVQTAEQEGGQDAYIRSPDGEDHQGDGKPAPIAEGVVGPDAAGVVHNIVKSAQARDLYLDTLMPTASAVFGFSPTARRCRPFRV